MDYDLTPYLTSGALRADAISGLQPEMVASLRRMFMSAPEDVRANLRVISAFRSPEVQERLWSDALQKYGSPEAARKWVAPPGRSRHNHGTAADLRFLDDKARAWVHENAARFGMHFPMDWEPWHIEVNGSRDDLGHQHAAPSAEPQPAPNVERAQPAQGGRQNALAPQWRVRRQDPNAFALDASMYRPRNRLV